MSLSPFKSTSQLSTRSNNTPLSLSQALLITAGLAGLVGLSSGIIIRFSLSHSSNARFLSPLQTFPALPNWTPELPEGGTANSQSPPDGGTDTQRANSAETDGTGTQSDRSYAEPESSPNTTLEPFVEQNQSNDLYTEPSAKEEASVYPEESYPEEPYPQDIPPEVPSAADDEYPQNYPTIEAPANGEAPYYGDGQQ